MHSAPSVRPWVEFVCPSWEQKSGRSLLSYGMAGFPNRFSGSPGCVCRTLTLSAGALAESTALAHARGRLPPQSTFDQSTVKECRSRSLNAAPSRSRTGAASSWRLERWNPRGPLHSAHNRLGRQPRFPLGADRTELVRGGGSVASRHHPFGEMAGRSCV